MPPSLRAYRDAEERLKLSLELRGEGFEHEYPRRHEDLALMRAYHAEYGWPPASSWGRFWWRVRVGLGWMRE